MAQVSQEHVNPLTTGFVVLLLVSLFGLAALNHFADK